MSENKKKAPKKVEQPKGMVNIEFTKDFGSYKKGDKMEYHISTAQGLLNNNVCKIVK